MQGRKRLQDSTPKFRGIHSEVVRDAVWYGHWSPPFRVKSNEELRGGGLQAAKDEEVMEKRRTRVINALALPPFRAW